MADYTYSRKTKYLFEPNSKYPFKLSRTKIDMFLECPRCFYLDRRLGVSKPSMPAFTLNVAVDALLKKEFDLHRARGSAHPLMEQYGIDAVPFQHEKMDQWRENFVGVQYVHPETNFLVFGAVDDLWVNAKGELHVVDYKATSKDGEIFLEDTKWHNQYRRQMEVYQWLLRHNGLKVSDTGYFVYVNGKKDRKAFDGKLEFDVKIIPYTGSDKWVENAIIKARKCLDGSLPPASKTCEYCLYKQISSEVEQEQEAPTKTVKKSTVAKARIKKQPAAASTLF